MTDETLSVVEAVQRDLDEIAKLDGELARGGLAATALKLAAELDSTAVEASAKASCARALKSTMDTLRHLAPTEKTEDVVHDLTGRARLKLAGGTDT
jgi:hypothetical protein